MFDEFYEVVKKIPKGSVASYGLIARLAGFHRCARHVGWALHSNPDPDNIPCHRVVFKNGSICTGYAFGGFEMQKAMLEKEGVKVGDNMRIDMKKFEWRE